MMRMGQRSGVGRMVWRDGSIYTGQWRKNLAQGLGSEIYPDGSTYHGQFHNDKVMSHIRKWVHAAIYGADYHLRAKRNGLGLLILARSHRYFP
jgi:hypothetical protein